MRQRETVLNEFRSLSPGVKTKKKNTPKWEKI